MHGRRGDEPPHATCPPGHCWLAEQIRMQINTVEWNCSALKCYGRDSVFVSKGIMNEWMDEWMNEWESKGGRDENKDGGKRKGVRLGEESWVRGGEKKQIPHKPMSIERELIPFRPFSRRRWNPIKLAYKLAGWRRGGVNDRRTRMKKEGRKKIRKDSEWVRSQAGTHAFCHDTPTIWNSLA